MKSLLIIQFLLSFQYSTASSELGTNVSNFDEGNPGKGKSLNNFTCPKLKKSDKRPTSVHQLRPGDIDIVAALGDSLTVGVGAGASPGSFEPDQTNYRGLSFSIGGFFRQDGPPLAENSDVKDHFTIPNALKRYNKAVKGWSAGQGEAGENVDNETASRLNMAVLGSTAIDLFNQARQLVKELKTNPKYNMAEDWKLLTLNIGAKDICESCSNPPRGDPVMGVQYVLETLGYLLTNVPRMLVNIVTPFDLKMFRTIAAKVPECNTLYDLCSCAFKKDYENRKIFEETIEDYKSMLFEIVVDMELWKPFSDFDVVLQPFFENWALPMKEGGVPDMSYFVPDCFHLSQKGHNYAAEALWNNMFQKMGQKSREWPLGSHLECPNEKSPFIYTNENSG